MTLRNFFSTVNFSYQYPPEAKAYLEPSRIPAMKLFREIFYFCEIHKKAPVPQSLFNKVIGFFPATSLKESTPIKVLSDKFPRYLRHLFYVTPPGDCSCSTKKCFTGKTLWGKRKMETPCKKNKDTCKTKT